MALSSHRYANVHTYLTMIIIITMKQNNFTNHTHFRVMMMGIIFCPLHKSGSFAGVYVNCVSRVYFKCFVNFIMTQTIECKMYDNKTDTSLGHGSSRPK